MIEVGNSHMPNIETRRSKNLRKFSEWPREEERGKRAGSQGENPSRFDDEKRRRRGKKKDHPLQKETTGWQTRKSQEERDGKNPSSTVFGKAYQRKEGKMGETSYLLGKGQSFGGMAQEKGGESEERQREFREGLSVLRGSLLLSKQVPAFQPVNRWQIRKGRKAERGLLKGGAGEEGAKRLRGL